MDILIVEDDLPLANVLKKVLEKNGFNVNIASDGEEAFNEILEKNYNLYLLDINLPKLNGHKLLKLIKHKDENAIVTMITASAEIEDIEKAYSYGCSEYIKKPFHAKELLIRINNLINKNEINDEIIVDNIKFVKSTMDLFIDNKPVELRKKEKRLLYILLDNLDKTVTKEKIIEFVWEGEKKDSYPLRQLVSTLKAKLSNHNIVSVVGIGYKFVKV
ncbi:response regulator transcription factor [Lebetimonas sp. JS085]|uniref:response regulator transcription factor n=1 Tax=Lebetimonas sp. JS085 TaxID=931222 RepID=UPI00046373A7|nr:response regulator transcription factor [Lebetimonas sp. JS085]